MLKSYSVKKLNRISKKREIWCWGCGKRFHEMLELYADEPFVSRITALIDGNRDLWQASKKVGGHQLTIAPYEQLKESRQAHTIILITVDSYKEIYKHIMQEADAHKILCCSLPMYYDTYTRYLEMLVGVLPFKRQLLFYTGSEPHENALALVEYLLKEYEGKPYKIVFVGAREYDRGRNLSGIQYLNPFTLRMRSSVASVLKYCYYYAGSKVLLYENQPLKKVKRGQKLVFMNHGTIPLKDVHDVLKQPQDVDYAVCPSKGCADIYEQQYGLPRKKHIYCMPPRTSMMRKDQEKIEQLLPGEDRQIIIWLPTFRTLVGTERKDFYQASVLPLLDEERNIQQLNQKLQDNKQMILLKVHPREKAQVSISYEYDCIHMLTDADLKEHGLVLQEILGGTAALITDYSGIAFEYLLLNQPVGYIVSDIDNYKRGFAFANPYEYMPGPQIKTIEELLMFLDDVKGGRDEHRMERSMLMQRLFQDKNPQKGVDELLHELDRLMDNP